MTMDRRYVAVVGAGDASARQVSQAEAVGRAIADGCRTGDIFSATEEKARKVGTREMGDAIAAAI